MLTFTLGPLYQRFFRSAVAAHSRPKVSAQRRALDNWAKFGRHTAVLTPRDLHFQRQQQRRHGSSSVAAESNGDSGNGELYDGLSRNEHAIPLNMVKPDGDDDQTVASEGTDSTTTRNPPKHGSWEWERMMIRRRAEASKKRFSNDLIRFRWQSRDEQASHSAAAAVDADDDDGEFDERQQQTRSASARSVLRANPPPPEATLAQKQLAFDEFLERVIVLFARPTIDALRTHEVLQLLHTADASFTPELFGSPELLYLLRNCRYLKSHRGRWAFVRQFDPVRDSVTVRLEEYRFREVVAQDLGVRTVPGIYRDVRMK